MNYKEFDEWFYAAANAKVPMEYTDIHIDSIFKLDKYKNGWIDKALQLFHQAKLKVESEFPYLVVVLRIPLEYKKDKSIARLGTLQQLKHDLSDTPPSIYLSDKKDQDLKTFIDKYLKKITILKQPSYNVYKYIYSDEENWFLRSIYIMSDIIEASDKQ